MLGLKLELFLLLVILVPLLLIDGFAEDFGILVETDRSEYQPGDSLIITGIIAEKKMPIVALRLYDPENSIISANQVDLQDDNTFSKIISLDGPMYEQPGDYRVTIDYGKLNTETTFTIISEHNGLDEIIEEKKEFLFPDVLVVTDKDQYKDGDTIIISGIVSSLKEPSVLVGIYDPFGFPSGFYFGDVDTDLEFFVSFPVKSGVNFKTEGDYSVVARYGESEDTISFNFIKNIIEQKNPTSPQDEYKDNSNKEKNNSNIINQPTAPKPKPQSKNTIDDEKLKTTQPKSVSKKQIGDLDNLTVEDVELGKILNRINLSCDKSELTEIISYYDDMGPALIRLCRYNEAISFYDNSLINNPNNIEILNNKGSALSKLGLYEESIVYFDSVLDINSKFVPSINNKANALSFTGNYNDAIILYQYALSLSPDNYVIFENLEMTKIKQSQMKKTNTPSPLPEEPKPKINQEHLIQKTEQTTLVENNEKQSSNLIEQINNAITSIGKALFGFVS